MTNKGFEAKGQIIKPVFSIEAVAHSSAPRYPSRFKRKKDYDGEVMKKQKSFSRLSF